MSFDKAENGLRLGKTHPKSHSELEAKPRDLKGPASPRFLEARHVAGHPHNAASNSRAWGGAGVEPKCDPAHPHSIGERAALGVGTGVGTGRGDWAEVGSLGGRGLEPALGSWKGRSRDLSRS